MGENLERIPGPEGVDISVLRPDPKDPDRMDLKFGLPTYYYMSVDKKSFEELEGVREHVVAWGTEKLVEEINTKLAAIQGDFLLAILKAWQETDSHTISDEMAEALNKAALARSIYNTPKRRDWDSNHVATLPVQ